MSNTKLNKGAKFAGKMKLAEFTAKGGVIFTNADTGVTVAVIPAFSGANTVRVSTSVASPDEKKFRPSVGRYNALANMEDGVFVVFPMPLSIEGFAIELIELSKV